MDKISSCKKCGTKQYSVVVVSKKAKKKYYRVCDNCKGKRRLYPTKVAFHLYYNLCEYDTALATKDLQDDKNFAQKYFLVLNRLKKEYKYIHHNLIFLIEYIYQNNYHKKFDSKFALIDIMNILKKYHEPITEEMCISIFNELDELLKNQKEEIEKKQ